MILSKFQRVIIEIILSITLLVFPLLGEIYYISFYYALVVLLILLQFLMEIFNWNNKLDDRFYVRWSKSRKDGFLINCIRQGLRSLLFMIVMVSIGLFFGNGLTPIDIVVDLPSSALFKIIVLLIIINSIIGIVSWHENEKRYSKICWNKEKSIYSKMCRNLLILLDQVK